jgi:hypothetical protein
MKLKIIIACILSTLVLSCTFGGASVIIEDSIENDFFIGQEDCIVYIIQPELGYMYVQFFKNVKPTELGYYEFLKNLNLALVICLNCHQLFVDTYLDCPLAAKARFSTKAWSTGEEFEKWDNDPSDGFSAFIDLPINYILFKDTKVDVYDSNDNWIGGHKVNFNVLVLPIISSS